MNHMQSILCFGDSNTHGAVPMTSWTHIERHGWENRWPGVLQDGLGDRYRVIEEGLPGRTTVLDDPIEGAMCNGRTWLKPCLLSHKPLDLVILMLGTNDLKNRFGLTADDVARGLVGLIDTVSSSNCGIDAKAPELLVVAPVPIDEIQPLGGIFRGASEKSKQLPKIYAQVCADYGIPFISAGDHAEVSPIDGIHLDANAQRRLGNAIGQVVRKIFA